VEIVAVAGAVADGACDCDTEELLLLLPTGFNMSRNPRGPRSSPAATPLLASSSK